MTIPLSDPRVSPARNLDLLVDQIMAQASTGLAENALEEWSADLRARLQRVQQHPEQNLGFIEEHIRQSALQLQCLLVQSAMQAKADAVEENCPDCHRPLADKKRRVERTVDAYCGQVKLRRTHGWCPKCKKHSFPADRALGLREDSNASPLVQEIGALLVTKMPAEQAEAISWRVTGRRLSRSTLARLAQAQGDDAIARREQMIAGPVLPSPKHQPSTPSATRRVAGADQPITPSTLVIQIDAWNIRERDFWGKTQAMTRRKEELNRWHWVYTATCFQLEQRCQNGKHKDKLRAVITDRSYVATRGGIDALMPQLYYEARARGLATAQRVIVIADGAVWIWNLVDDRFAQAIQRLDLFHANSYLWAVANELHGKGSAQARQWVKPLLRQLRHDQAPNVISKLEDLLPQLKNAAANAASAAIEYFSNNRSRMKYKDARRRNEPVGSGAIESTCRQLQCRMKRPGQFWSTAGDEALLCLDLFWRNDRWHLLFPHVSITSVANN
jgi:transposase